MVAVEGCVPYHVPRHASRAKRTSLPIHHVPLAEYIVEKT